MLVQGDAVLGDLADCLAVLRAIVHQSLVGTSLGLVEKFLESLWLLDPLVVSECTIEQLDHFHKAVGLLSHVLGHVLHLSPRYPRQRGHQVQRGLLLPLRDLHLREVEHDPRPPVLVVGRPVREDGDII